MRLAPVPFLLIFALGCPEGGTDDTSGGKDSADTGDTGDIDLGPPGCINLNTTEGDFATIADALVYAQPGDAVHVCAGSYSEKVSVPAGVSIVGEGSATTLIDAPVNEPAFEFTGAGGGVSGFTITSTRSGVTLDGASDIAITDLVFDAVANYGIESVNATGVVISASTFDLPAFGGVYVSGGSLTIDSSAFNEPTSYGVWASGDSTVTVSNNTFTMVHATVNDGSDGHAVFVDDSTVTMQSNVISGNDLIGVWTDGGSLAMNGDVILDTPYALFAQNGAFSATGVEIYGALNQGMYVVATEPVNITDTVVDLNGGATTGLVSCSEDYDADRSYYCGGILVAAAEINLTGVSVADYEDYGLFVVPARNSLALTVSDVTLDNTGRWGLYAESATGTIDGLTSTNHREPDSTGLSCYSVDRSAAVVLVQSDVVVTNSSIVDSAGWGISAVAGNLEVGTSSFSGSGCAGIVNFQAALTVTGSTFGPNGEWGGIFDYQGASIIEGNTFVDSKRTATYEYDDGAGGYYRYVYAGYGRDFYGVQSTACLVKDNVFSGGDESMMLEVMGCTITGNTWTDYNGTLVSVYQGDSSDPVLVSGNNADNIAGPIVYSTYGHAEVEDFQIGATVAYEYSNEGWYVASDGTETLQWSSTGSYGQPAFSAYGYHYGSWSDTDGDGVVDTYTDYGYSASLKLSNVSIETTYDSLVEASEASLELVDVSVGTVGGYGVSASWSYYAPEVEIEGMELGSTAYTGLYLDGNTADAGYVAIADVDIDVAGGSGLQVSGIAEVTVEDLKVLDAASYGVITSGDYSYYDYEAQLSVSGTLEPLVELSGVEVLSATYEGISISNGTPVVDECSASGGDASGLLLTSTSAEVTNSTFDSNAEYGMECVSTTLTTCAGNVLDANGLGAHLDCSDDCTI